MHINLSREQGVVMSDQKVSSFVLVATTASYEGSDSTRFEFEIPGVAASSELKFPMSEGETQAWPITANPANLSTLQEILSNDIILRGDENPFDPEPFRWTPAAFYLLGKYEDGQYVVICAISDWPGDALGDDASVPGVSNAIELNQFNSQQANTPPA